MISYARSALKVSTFHPKRRSRIVIVTRKLASPDFTLSSLIRPAGGQSRTPSGSGETRQQGAGAPAGLAPARHPAASRPGSRGRVRRHVMSDTIITSRMRCSATLVSRRCPFFMSKSSDASNLSHSHERHAASRFPTVAGTGNLIQKSRAAAAAPAAVAANMTHSAHPTAGRINRPRRVGALLSPRRPGHPLRTIVLDHREAIGRSRPRSAAVSRVSGTDNERT